MSLKLASKKLIIVMMGSILMVGCGKRNAEIESKDPSDIVFKWTSSEGIKDKQHDLTRLDIKSINLAGKRILIDGDFVKKIRFGSKSIENDRINFIAAYPNANEPEFILIESGSNGTCCPWTNFHLLIKNKGIPKLIEIPSNSVAEITAIKSNSDGYDFIVKYISGEEKSGDPRFEYMTTKVGDDVFLKQGIRSEYPGIARISYGSELFSNKELRSKIFNLSDSELGELRNQIQMESTVVWQDGSALLLCAVPTKGEWDTSQIIAIDLERKAYEIQRFLDGKLKFIKKFGEIRSEIRNGFAFNGECFQTKYQKVGVGK